MERPGPFKIEIDINDIQIPTAIYIIYTEEVILNERASKLLGMRSNQVFDLTAWRKINPLMQDMFRKQREDSEKDQKIPVILFNGRQEIFKYSLKRTSIPTLGNVVLIHFSKVSNNEANSSYLMTSLKEELINIKPYLNRNGKTIYRKIMKKYFGEDNRQLTLDDLVHYEKELRVIQQTYPMLTHRELILCSLLVNEHEINEIALITNRTPESVSVTIHRINKKLHITSRKELIDTLKGLINDVET